MEPVMTQGSPMWMRSGGLQYGAMRVRWLVEENLANSRRDAGGCAADGSHCSRSPAYGDLHRRRGLHGDVGSAEKTEIRTAIRGPHLPNQGVESRNLCSLEHDRTKAGRI